MKINYDHECWTEVLMLYPNVNIESNMNLTVGLLPRVLVDTWSIILKNILCYLIFGSGVVGQFSIGEFYY